MMSSLVIKSKRAQRLIREYIDMADELDGDYHGFGAYDECMYDAEGYSETMYEAFIAKDEEYMNEILNDLMGQVKAMRQILQGFRELKFIYG